MPDPSTARLVTPADLQALLACARVRMDAGHRDTVSRAVREGADWSAILDLAAAHGLLPLLHEHASRGDVDPPAASRQRLAAMALGNARRSLTLGAELLAVVNACASRGIRVLPLKGPLLAQQVYGSPVRRQPRDIDMLVRRQDLGGTIDVLRGRGYQLSAEVPPALYGMLRLNSHHLPAAVSATAKIEVHHCLSPHPHDRLTLDAIGDRLTTTEFLGATVETLTPEDQLVYLCEHGSYHAWSRLEWLVTFQELASQRLDWHRVETWAGEWRGRRRIETALAAAARILGDDRRPSRPGSARAAVDRIQRKLREQPLLVIAPPIERLTYMLATDVSVRSRLGRCWRTLALPSHEDLSFVRLPAPLRVLYYGVRPIRMLTAAARRLAA